MADQEKNANCAKCNKPVKRIKRYYRNGKFWCGKKCFKENLKKADDKPS